MFCLGLFAALNFALMVRSRAENKLGKGALRSWVFDEKPAWSGVQCRPRQAPDRQFRTFSVASQAARQASQASAQCEQWA